MVLALLQGMCPMCAGMGIWMLLFWIIVLVAVGAGVWLLVRMLRK